MNGVHHNVDNGGVAASSASTAGFLQPTGLSYENDERARSIELTGAGVTLRRNTLLQIDLDPVQRDIALYRSTNGQTQLLSAYRLNGNQGELSLREAAPATFAAAAPARRSDVASTENTVFRLLNAKGEQAIFNLALMGGQALISAENNVAADLLGQNHLQTVAAAALAAGQDLLGLDLNKVEAVIIQ